MTQRGKVLCVALLAGLACAAQAGDDLAALRERVMEDVFVLRAYRPGKNSFVESPQRHAGAWNAVGFRHTLLDLQGQGSLRHIWTTRGAGAPYFDWEFYVDGEATPSLRGTDEELVRAAQALTQPLAGVAAPTVPLARRDFNLFVPIPFERALRVDVVQRVPSFWLWFCQLDYRLQDASLAGARLLGQREGTNLVLVARDWPPARVRHRGELSHATLESVEVPPGRSVTLAADQGPGIARELFIECSQPDTVRLLVSYDDAPDAAVNAPVQRFFGPFQGASFERHSPTATTSYLPMPFRRNLRVSLKNEGTNTVRVAARLQIERVKQFGDDWGYFHARYNRAENTDGHRLFQVLYLRGRGHWLGMSLFGTGHDHGGGDFAIVDGEGADPAFLHGINGEDYFTFAWFGRGAHHPYAVAHANDEGRYRHHFENPYPFRTSFALEWGAYPGLRPESVAVWYQDTPRDTTLPDGARAEAVAWDVFGPVPIPHDTRGISATNWTAVLPTVAELDAGGKWECRLVDEKFEAGWMREWSVGPALNLTYIGRHGTKIKGEVELGGMGHAFLARRFIESPVMITASYVLAHDDPIEIAVNGAVVYQAGAFPNGFEARTINLPLRLGKNEIVVRLVNHFNRNFNWAGFLLRPGP